MGAMDENHREELFSKAVRAGKRTYFFDVKTTRGNDLYLTITESKKRYDRDGSGKFHYEKHKLFLYKEDFEKFADGLSESIDKVAELRATGNYKADTDFGATNHTPHEEEPATMAAEPADSDEEITPDDADGMDETTDEATATPSENEFTDVSFEDLGGDEEVKEE